MRHCCGRPRRAPACAVPAPAPAPEAGGVVRVSGGPPVASDSSELVRASEGGGKMAGAEAESRAGRAGGAGGSAVWCGRRRQGF